MIFGTASIVVSISPDGSVLSERARSETFLERRQVGEYHVEDGTADSSMCWGPVKDPQCP